MPEGELALQCSIRIVSLLPWQQLMQNITLAKVLLKDYHHIYKLIKLKYVCEVKTFLAALNRNRTMAGSSTENFNFAGGTLLCKYLANENARNKNQAPCNLNTQLSSSYIYLAK